MNTLTIDGVVALDASELVQVAGGAEPQTLGYRVGQWLAVAADYYVGMWQGFWG